MRRVCPFFILVAMVVAGCASRKPSVQASAVTVRSDSLNLTMACLSTATLHDVTVIPADTMGDVVHIRKVELDRRTHAQTMPVTAETAVETHSETPRPAS